MTLCLIIDPSFGEAEALFEDQKLLESLPKGPPPWEPVALEMPTKSCDGEECVSGGKTFGQLALADGAQDRDLVGGKDVGCRPVAGAQASSTRSTLATCRGAAQAIRESTLGDDFVSQDMESPPKSLSRSAAAEQLTTRHCSQNSSPSVLGTTVVIHCTGGSQDPQNSARVSSV